MDVSGWIYCARKKAPTPLLDSVAFFFIFAATDIFRPTEPPLPTTTTTTLALRILIITVLITITIIMIIIIIRRRRTATDQ